MRYRIEHLTDYRYAGTAALTQQALRLSPRRDAHQRVIQWRIRVPGTLTATTDAYGNLNHMHTLDRKHDRVRIEAMEVALTVRRLPESEEGAQLTRAEYLTA